MIQYPYLSSIFDHQFIIHRIVQHSIEYRSTFCIIVNFKTIKYLQLKIIGHWSCWSIDHCSLQLDNLSIIHPIGYRLSWMHRLSSTPYSASITIFSKPSIVSFVSSFNKLHRSSSTQLSVIIFISKPSSIELNLQSLFINYFWSFVYQPSFIVHQFASIIDNTVLIINCIISKPSIVSFVILRSSNCFDHRQLRINHQLPSSIRFWMFHPSYFVHQNASIIVNSVFIINYQSAHCKLHQMIDWKWLKLYHHFEKYGWTYNP